MPIPADHPLARTYSFHIGNRNAAADIVALGEGFDGSDPIIHDVLLETVLRNDNAANAKAALWCLANSDSGAFRATILATIREACSSSYPSVRQSAVQCLGVASNRVSRGTGVGLDSETAILRQRLNEDSSRLVRRDSLRLLARTAGERRWAILDAADDPHWRVRKELVSTIVAWGHDARSTVESRLANQAGDGRVDKLLEYLRYRWNGRDVFPAPFEQHASCEERLDEWDWDPAVLAFTLHQLSDERREQIAPVMVGLVGHEDDRVAKRALDILDKWGGIDDYVATMNWLAEPRLSAAARVRDWLERLDLDRRETMAESILANFESADPNSLAWAIDQAESVFPASAQADCLRAVCKQYGELPRCVRAAVVSLSARWPEFPLSSDQLENWLHDDDLSVVARVVKAISDRALSIDSNRLAYLVSSPCVPVRREAVGLVLSMDDTDAARLVEMLAQDGDWTVRLQLARRLAKKGVGEDEPSLSTLALLQKDEHAYIRAAALNADRARYLIESPSDETSWHVLSRAAQMMQRPLWQIVPEDIDIGNEPSPPSVRVSPAADEIARPPREFELRSIGKSGTRVSPLGLSGHYGLPAEGFTKGVERGINLLFWEPNYDSLAKFSQSLSAGRRAELHFIVGTFEASAKQIRANVLRALRVLRIEQVRFFQLFWVRSWRRISPEVVECLDELCEEGLIGEYGLSTHSRPLAVEALGRGWNPIMVRHSAAHRGAEESIFPTAIETGVGLITFNNTCYGRLLEPLDGRPSRVSAADCYRFSLANPAVSVCLTAPATLDQLDENLQVLDSPEIDEETIEWMELHGAKLYEEERAFTNCIRSL